MKFKKKGSIIMALLTDKETKKNLSERLEEFLQFGMVFNYMLETEKIELKDLEKMFLDTDQEKATFAYTYLLGKVAPNDIESSYALYSYKYPNDRGLDTDKYNSYLNSSCIRNILNEIANKEKRLNETYINTYNYLLEDEGIRK